MGFDCKKCNTPKCRWVLDEENAECAKDCFPVCKEPQNCHVVCAKPKPQKCKTVCPEPICRNTCKKTDCNTKFSCSTECKKLACYEKCENDEPKCDIVCDEPQCQVSCREPKGCKQPKLRLMCN